jgi:hypothetical protein
VGARTSAGQGGRGEGEAARLRRVQDGYSEKADSPTPQAVSLPDRPHGPHVQRLGGRQLQLPLALDARSRLKADARVARSVGAA